MDRISGECQFFNLEKVIFGPGKVEALARELDRLGARRAILATGRTLGASPLLDRVTGAMSAHCVGVFSEITEHGANDSAEALAAEMRRLEADSIVSFGGSSPSDTAKVAVAAVLSGRRVADLATLEILNFVDIGPATREIPHITLPTTLSAGEYTCGGGATDAQGIKGAVMNPRLEIKVVINDPELTVETPDQLWLSTGIRALDHIVEAFYSQYNQPFTDALAAKALTLLREHLPASVRGHGEKRIEHRGHCQTAAWLSNYAAVNTRYGVSHAVGHKIGPKWGIPHGITSCITLPFAMRFMADRAPERFEALAAALAVDFDRSAPAEGARRCIEAVGDFIGALGLPRSLKEVGIEPDRFDEVVDNILYEIVLLDAVGGPVSRGDVVELLQRMHDGKAAAA